MSGITTGVGLISGIDYQSIIDQMMSIEARPRDQLMTRMSTIDAQRTAYLDISARITALLARVQLLTQPNSFRAATAKSSLPDVLSATATSSARPGTYTFVVRALAATHQAVTRGFSDASAPLSTGTLTIESAEARVNSATSLNELNGHIGVRRGSIKLTNSTGQDTVVNLSDALTVSDVLDKINAAGAGVRASVRGDGFALTDTAGGTGILRVQEVDGGHTAADLGFGTGHTTGTGGELAGTSVVYLSGNSPISALNDGLGVRRSEAGGDFSIDTGGQSIDVDLSDVLRHDTRLERLNHGQAVRLGRVRITSRDRMTTEVDLSGARTVGDVTQAIQSAFGDTRLSVVVNGSHLMINDNTDTSKLADGQTSDFIIEDVTGHAAHDLGIDGRASDGRVSGRDILHMDTLADVTNAINYAVGNLGDDKQPLVTAALSADGGGITLRTQEGPFTLKAPSGDGATSKTLADLGLQAGTYYDMGGGAQAVGARIVGSLNTVMLKSLNGGAGFAGAALNIQANGKTASLDVSGAKTLADVIALIDGATDATGAKLGVEAAYDATGTRLQINNTTADSPITISGDFAESIGLAQTGSTLKSANLQRQYVNEGTRLDALNAGRGISRGSFKITNSKGIYAAVDLTSTSITNLQDVINAINQTNIGVTAGINETGDGLLLTDTAGGTAAMKVEEQGGTVAHDLNLLQTARDNRIDGAFEFKLDVGGSDTLQSLADRISAETTLARATVMNDGTNMAPYRLSISALTSGTAGELIIDDSSTDLGVTTLARAQDARVYFGGNSTNGVLLTSSSNTFTNVVDGLTFTANGIDERAVSITVDRDTESIGTALKGLADDYNTVVDRISQATAYDSEKQVLGILQGEGTINSIQQRLYRMFTGAVQSGGSFTRLSQLGLGSAPGGKLSFDEDKFKAAYAANPDAVERFFSDPTNGAAVQIKKQIDAITDTGGLIENRTGALSDTKTLLQTRVDQLNEQLDRKRARLLAQFQAMEQALSQLQSQQQALSGFASSLSTATSSTTGR